MDRLHRKKRSFGQDNLDYWYLTPTISSADLVTAYKFIHAESAEQALYNLNYDVVKAPYKLSKSGGATQQETIVWEADKGYTIGYRQGKDSVQAGLENVNLRNLGVNAIKSAILRVEIPACVTSYTGLEETRNVQYLTQPSCYFGMTRQYASHRDSGGAGVSSGYAICLNAKSSNSDYQALGGRGFPLGGTGNTQTNRYAGANEFVIVGGYDNMPKSKPTDADVFKEANLTLYDGEDFEEGKKTFYNSSTRKIENMVYGGEAERYVFMSSSKYYWINVKAAAFYNRLLTEQEHNDLVRMIWKI